MDAAGIDRRPATGRGRVRVRLLIAAARIAPVLGVGLARATAPGDGTLTYSSTPAWSARGVALIDVLPGWSGLRTGDCVRAVNGVPLTDLATGVRRLPADQTDPGSVLTYRIARPAEADARKKCLGPELDVPVPVRAYPIAAAAGHHVAGLPLLIVVFGVASFVLLHRPNDPPARALFAAAVFAPLGITAWPLGNQVLDLATGPRLWPFVGGELANTLAWGALLHFMLVFPQSPRRLRSRPWLVTGVYLFPLLLHLCVVAVLVPQTQDTLHRLGLVTAAAREAGVAVPPLLVTALVLNYRATKDRATRARVRWLLYTFAACATLYLALSQIPGLLLGHPLVSVDWNPIFFLPFPLALGAAVLRYSLFDIDVIVRRSLVYVAVTALGAAIYLGCAVALDQVTGDRSPIVPILAAGLLLLGAQPLLTRARRGLTRLIFGARDDPSEVLNRLSTRLGAVVDLDSVLPSIVETIGHSLRLGHAEIELTLADGSVERVSFGSAQAGEISVPLNHQGEEIGRLLLAAAPGREPFGPADQSLIDTLVSQVSVTAYNVLLQRQLQRSLERVVSAREEERRRLRRDIHDGVGPTLAAGTLRLEVAKSLFSRDPGRAEELLDGVIALQQNLTREVRGLVDGLRPAVLDQLGLVSALRHQAASLSTDGSAPGGGLQIHLDAPAELTLSAAVEVAAYRIVTEALANVARHAHARTAQVRLRYQEGALIVQVSDDGTGLPPRYRAGVGLSSMRERAIEVGGSCTVTPAPDGGTTVLARLPVPAAEAG